MPSSGASSARHIVGADAFGEVNDEEVRGSGARRAAVGRSASLVEIECGDQVSPGRGTHGPRPASLCALRLNCGLVSDTSVL